LSNPWLAIPLADYEGHMQLPDIQQLAALSALFARALHRVQPASVTVLGIAGGNGLEQIDPKMTHRVLGLDVNSHYLDAVRQRFISLPGLELCQVDLAAELPPLPHSELVHAALIFEHAGTDRCLDNAASLVAPQGALSVVLQVLGEAQHPVASSPFPSMQTLKSRFAIVDPAKLTESLGANQFHLKEQTRVNLPGSKAFWFGLFRRLP
jgi:hypothetical protein